MSKSKQPPIPPDIREQADQVIAEFNRSVIKNPECFYVPRYRGNYLYLDRHNYGPVGPIGRLTYQGGMDNWDFAIYLYSRERYDTEEWLFPGAGQLDGTIEGAMKAGLEAYPLSDYNNTSLLGRVLAWLYGQSKSSG